MKISKRIVILVGAALALPLMSGPTEAGQETAQITVTANVVAACTLETPPPAQIDVGAIVAGSGGLTLVGPFSPVVNCPTGFQFEWGFDAGQNPVEPSPGDPQMLLVSGDNTDPNQLLLYFMTGSDGLAIGNSGATLISPADTNSGDVEIDTGTGANQALDFSVAVPEPPATQMTGSYEDSITFLFAF